MTGGGTGPLRGAGQHWAQAGWARQSSGVGWSRSLGEHGRTFPLQQSVLGKKKHRDMTPLVCRDSCVWRPGEPSEHMHPTQYPPGRKVSLWKR